MEQVRLRMLVLVLVRLLDRISWKNLKIIGEMAYGTKNGVMMTWLILGTRWLLQRLLLQRLLLRLQLLQLL
jgi:hypothetical protein